MAVQYCVNCGDGYAGKGDLCPDCIPITQRETEPLPPAQTVGIKPLPRSRDPRPRCPYCAETITWDSVQRLERRFGVGCVEVIYYCPHCRCALEFGGWIEIPERRPSASEHRHRPRHAADR